MAVGDWYFNESKFIQFKQQEFYATGLFADAVLIHPEPGYGFDALVLQLPAEANQNRVQWGWPDDTTNFATGEFDVTNPPTTLFAPFNLVRNGFNSENVNFLSLSYPAFVDGPNVNGAIAVEEVVIGNPNFRVGPLPVQWIGSQVYQDLIQLETLIANRNALYRERMPGEEQLFPGITEEFLIEFPGMFLMRLFMYQEPTTPSTSTGLPRYYKAGWVSWGHK